MFFVVSGELFLELGVNTTTLAAGPQCKLQAGCV